MTAVSKPRAVTTGDEVLVERMRRGDRDAAQELYLRHFDYVEALLHRLFGGSSILEDALQDTFVTATERISALRDPSKVRAWLTTIAVNRARYYLTRQQRRRWLANFFRADPSPSIEQPNSVELGEIYRALDRVPAGKRLPWMLHRVEGLTLDETAAACGMSRSTVKRRIAAAENRLKRLLDVD